MSSHDRPSAHAVRHPHKPLQDLAAPRLKVRRGNDGSDANAKTRTLATTERMANRAKVDKQIDEFYALRDETITKIHGSQTKENRMTLGYIRAQITSSAYTKAERAPNVYNVFVSEVHEKMKADDPRALAAMSGLCMSTNMIVGTTLLEAQQEVKRRWKEARCKKFSEYLSEEEKERLRNKLKDKGDHKHTASRTTNISNALDLRKNARKLQTMVRAPLLFTRSRSLPQFEGMNDRTGVQCTGCGQGLYRV
jgi:hypothetical protein